MTVEMSNTQSFLQLYVDQMKFTGRIIKGVSALLFQSVVPYRGFDHYRRYFSICTKVTVQKDAATLFSFKLYFFLLTYLALLYLVFYFISLNPTARVLLVDNVFIMKVEKQFYIFIFGIICWTIHLQWSVYYCSINRLNSLAENVIFDGQNFIHSTKEHVRFTTIEGGAKYRRIVQKITSTMQIFIVFMDLCLLVFVSVFGIALTKSDFLFESVVNFFFLFPVLLFHLVLNLVFWISFGHTFCFIAIYAQVGLVFLHLIFKQNHGHLESALRNVYRRPAKVVAAMQENLHIFGIFFYGNAFFGPILLVYLALNMPCSSYLIMEIVFGFIQGVMLFVTLGMIGQALLGSLGTHLYAAFISNYVHKSGKLLLSFMGRQNHLNDTDKRVPVMLKIKLSSHISRLVVRRKYGINYGGRGNFQIF